jgi:opacity protein-like surface antigen
MPFVSRLTVLFAAAALAVPSLARAGDPPIGVNAFAAIDFNSFAASKTYKAVFDSSMIPGYGGGADITFGNLFVRVAFTSVSKTGSRVVVNGSDVFKLNNEPAKLSLKPIEIGGGWQFRIKGSKLTPYAGGGVLIEPYKVDYATSPDLNESETFTGGDVFGGAQYAISKVLFVGGEAQYRILPNALKSDLASSAANAFGETQGGGFTGRITIGVKFGK